MNSKILDVTNDVKWIGVFDSDLVTFDVVMETKYGTTYNSYFINAQKKTIVETTKEKFWDEYLKKIEQVCRPEEIEYIIMNHTEPDHSGNLKNLLRIAPNATVVGTGNAIRYLKDLMGIDFRNLVVKDGHTLDLGNKTIQFISAPNLHWPDTMYSYLREDKVLFTCDSFGAHFCDDNMFEENIQRREEYDYSFKYYFDVILKPYSKFMLKAIDKIEGLEIETIATGHGPILRENWKKYVGISRKYSEEALTIPERPMVYIPYVSAYQKTGAVAHLIADGIRQAGDIDVEVSDIEMVPMGELEEKIAHASAYVIGSPTINQNILLPIYKCFALINPIRDKGKLAGAFGSYGWSGEAKELIKSNLENLKLKVFDEGVFVKFTPNTGESEMAIAFGKAFGEELLAITN
ncbi:MAG: FprA family A-type flavoprotein [Bacteroidales bacterium]|nr:FprA family A-type flavoprotein [Bacteroidales bacterium]